MKRTVTKNAFGRSISDKSDLILGTGKDEVIDGKGGDDVIKAGGGNDDITGGRGNDLLSGDSGADTFFFGVSHGADKITDFCVAAGDQIVLQGDVDGYLAFEGDSGDVRLVTLTQNADETYSKTGSITLVGISPDLWEDMAGEEIDTYDQYSTWEPTTAENQQTEAPGSMGFIDFA